MITKEVELRKGGGIEEFELRSNKNKCVIFMSLNRRKTENASQFAAREQKFVLEILKIVKISISASIFRVF